MSTLKLNAPFTRRRALAMGAGVAGGIVVATACGSDIAFADTSGSGEHSQPPPPEVTEKISQIIGAEGKASNGVYSIDIDRNDITNVKVHGVPIYPSFQVNGDMFFQMAGSGRTAMNADFALKAEELNPFIHQLVQHKIVFQAQHQHLYDFSPMVWFVHCRALGDAEDIARGLKAALNVTSTPFPQSRPKNPTTPLPAKQLGEIIGAKPSIGSHGVVNFNVPRAENIRLGGIVVSPYLNVAAPIAFQPLEGGKAAAVPDFAMIASEVNDVVGLMQKQGWDIGCLYNQETDEHPQLYFSHQFKTGDPIQLAHEIRNGLNRTNSKMK